MQLKDIMTPSVETIAPSASLMDAAGKMFTEDVGSLPVTEQGRVVGILTDRDITIRAVAKGLDPETTTVEEVMTTEVLSCHADSDVEDACDLMEERQVRRLLVMDENDAPVGIVSLGDLALCLREDQSGEVLREVSQP
jgi:CBS domain-containing protein